MGDPTPDSVDLSALERVLTDLTDVVLLFVRERVLAAAAVSEQSGVSAHVVLGCMVAVLRNLADGLEEGGMRR